jgi:isocitrate lyase
VPHDGLSSAKLGAACRGLADPDATPAPALATASVAPSLPRLARLQHPLGARPEHVRREAAPLIHLFLVHRYKVDLVHYVSPTDDNQYQATKMKSHGIFAEVTTDIGQIIVADVNPARIAELLEADRVKLSELIRKES